MRILAFLFLSTAAVLRAAEPAPGTVFYHTSWPEASAVAVVGSPAKWLAVADNELPRIAVYSLERPSSRLHAPALREAVSPTYAVDDLEAVTVFPWDIDGDGKAEETFHVFAASCSRTKKGKVEPQRDALFAVGIKATGTAGREVEFTPPDKVEYNRTLRGQLRALGGEHMSEAWGPVLRDSAWAQGKQADAPDAALAGGGTDGLNIEGLTVSSDGRSLLLGLRSPLVEGKALLVPVSNPVGALGLGESSPQPVALAEPFLLDLGGLGFRSIEWDAAHKVYLIAAGSADDTGVFRLFTWSGNKDDAPVPATSASAAAVAKIEPEGITPVPGAKNAVVVGDGVAGAPYHMGLWVEVGGMKKAE